MRVSVVLAGGSEPWTLLARYVPANIDYIVVCVLFQSEVKIYTNRLNSVDSVIPYEYTR